MSRNCFPIITALALTAVVVAATPPADAATAPSWRLVASPNAPLQQDNLAAVSCPKASACVAVGHSRNAHGNIAPLAKSWNGHTWTGRYVPRPAGAIYATLTALSCTSATYCIAVGDYVARLGAPNTTRLAARWNGKSWKLILSTGAGFLDAVSCSAYDACTAVGGTNPDTGDYVSTPVAERWNDHSWAGERVPVFPGPSGIAFTGVACTSARWCVAVGYDFNLGDMSKPISARWTPSSAWKAEPISPPPAPPNTTFTFTITGAVSCSSSTSCTVIGNSSNSDGDSIPMADRWNGRRWTNLPVPSSIIFGGISCPTAQMCLAVSGQQTDLWNGTAWVIQAAANPAATGSLNAVDCSSDVTCTAVGSVGVAGGGTRTLAERWHGTMWSVQATPGNPLGGQFNELTSVACTAPGACLAVGSAGSGMLAERWNGTAWLLAQPPAVAGATRSSLAAVSCATATACVAVGAATEDGSSTAVAESWDGTSWSALPTPVGVTSLSGISCPSGATCVAVGSGSSGPTADRWNGSTWTPQTLAAAPSSLTAVSCTGSVCMAVGSNAAEYWNGSSWTLESVPAGPVLTAVSCPDASDCTAVGLKDVIDYWNGTTWAVQKPATTKADLVGVSCTARSACTAVGGYSSNLPFLTPLLVQRWNGSRWTTQHAPVPPGNPDNWLAGVSCTSATTCMGVGGLRNAVDLTQTLTYRYS
jgi:hypothetical protein